MIANVVTDWAEVWRLEPEWNALLARSRADSVFFTWEWVKCWSEIHRNTSKPFVVVVRDDRGMLVGLAPFYVGESRLLGILRYRVLRIIGDYASGAEYLDWIADQRCEKEVFLSIVAALKKQRRRWDCIWMPYVPEHTGANKDLVSVCSSSGLWVRTRPADFGYVDLPRTFEEYIRGMSRNRREHLTAEMNRTFSQQAEVRQCERESDLPQYISALFRLHGMRRSLLGDPGVFTRKPAEAEFYRRFSAIAMKRGWLRLYGLWCDGEFRAVQYGYAYKGIFYQLQEGFAPEFVKGCGNALRAKVIEQCIEEGLRGYDFLGDMTEHKRRWRAVQRCGDYVFVARPNIKNAIVMLIGLWPTGRYFRLTNLGCGKSTEFSEPSRAAAA